MLNMKPHIPIHKLEKYPMLYHGDWGTYKTTTAAQTEKPYFLMFEKNDEYPLYRTNIVEWEQCVEVLNYILNNEHPFKTIIFDNVDKFYDLASQAFIHDFNNHLSKGKPPIINLSGAGYAHGYDAVDRMISIVLNPFIMSEKFNLIFIAHSETRQFDTLTGDSFHKLSPALPNKRARAYFLTAASNIFYFYHIGKKTFIRIVGNDFVVAKNRGGETHFKTTKGESIINIPCGRNPKETYQYIQAAYFCKLKNSYKNVDELQ